MKCAKPNTAANQMQTLFADSICVWLSLLLRLLAGLYFYPRLLIGTAIAERVLTAGKWQPPSEMWFDLM